MKGSQGLRFRTRKLNAKQPLPVLREDQIESDEYKELLENEYKVETGVEKSEENEYHLQQALAAALGRGGSKDAQNIVPAPPSEASSAIDFDKLYPPDNPPSSTYIRFSETVEECTGCQYNMTTEDDIYLKSYNQKQSPSNQCSEDDFENIMDVFESTAEHKAPFASVDNTVVAFEVMQVSLEQELSKESRRFAKDIFEYWKARRQASENRSLAPSLKFELNQDNDDADPYVCFRRRDVRQTRKTRARDVQSTEKLKRLRRELEDARELVNLAYEREVRRKEQIEIEEEIFEMRAKLRDVRMRLGIKVDDGDLITQKEPPKRKIAEIQNLQRPQGPHLRLPTRPDGRPIEADLVQLVDLQAEKENQFAVAVEEKRQQRQKFNEKFIDSTGDPLSEVQEQSHSSGFRHATTQYLMTPPGSWDDGAESSALPTQIKWPVENFRYASPDDELTQQPAFRTRIGRGGRQWIDRRGLPQSFAKQSMTEEQAERSKYDQDDEDEYPTIEVDPFGTEPIRFRANIVSERYAPVASSPNSRPGSRPNPASLPAQT